ncbi:MAG: hypothetical protein EOQ64_03595 [Mesorhizobium sp.]|uniref:hypothetical protein n=1 Tax=Mesorhizobium sp. TaxID=1871066 RepID=UPI000FE7D865|nr:hypothetical protein [Mesorhizobium sp.]RWG59786.1 MAG: hypothetical protein EOQ64_03595 [Mesorhizobium sp.]RWH46415.1 MAG: hypothetical protein EOQ78_03825 [Mesorhizobium sp.]RWI25874.1 MAG: hypothetical protein EOQ94_09825 [Mesorhizobium sp.]
MSREGKAMRWGRGLFQLWLVVAVLSVGIGAYVNFSGSPHFPELHISIKRDGSIAAFKPSDDLVKILDAAVEGDLSKRQSLAGYPDGAVVYYADTGDDDSTQSNKLQKVTSYLDAERARIESEYWTPRWKAFFYLSVLPPLLLLAFGTSIGWALAGFRRGSP